MALTAPIRSNCASVSASSSSDLLPSSISLLWRGSQTVTEATSGLISLCNQAECVPSSKTTSTLPLNPRKKSQMFSALVLTFEWLSIWPSAFKTTITVIALWTSMPTYLTLLIGRLLDVRNLGLCLFKITTSGASFHITCSSCGQLLEELPLSVREWDCPACGVHHDRDINAAINIKRAGQYLLKTTGWGARRVTPTRDERGRSA